MIKLFERLPETITVDGRKYKCDFDFRNVLKMLEIMQREDIYPDARDCLCVKCVITHRMPLETALKVYKELCAMLFGRPVESAENTRIMSYEQDAGLIRTAFRQVYHIDLFRDKLNWFEFVELMQNLPEGNRFEETIGIRARPLPAPTKYNAKEREWLMKAKQSVALHLTEHEQAKKYDSDAGKIFAGLMGIIQREQKEVGNNGE